MWTQLILPDHSDAAFTEYALLEELTQTDTTKNLILTIIIECCFGAVAISRICPRRMQHAQQSPQKIFGLQRPVIDGLRRW
ncbi:MAG: hypothetical protein AB7D07_10925 [Desulfovibrionaceae bacterium]